MHKPVDRAAIKTALIAKQRELWEPLDSVTGQGLLHFTNAEAVLSILSKRELWLTDFEQVNDQHEGTYGTTLFYELSKTKSVSDKVREILRGGIGMKEKWGIYACCLCAGGQTRKMWADYADCAKGGAIGFRYDLLFQAAVTSQAYALHPVLYNRDRQLDIATKTLDYAIHYKRNAEIGSWDEDSYWLEALLVVVGCASRFKDPIWSNEEEIRVAVWEPNPESRFEEDGKRRTKVAFDPATVTRVIRGKTAGPELSVEKLRALLDEHGYSRDLAIVEATC